MFLCFLFKLQHFVNSFYTGGRCAVIGTGISKSELSSFAQNLELSSNSCETMPSKYCGGELRKERNSQIATVALAVEGTGFEKDNEALAFAILQQAAGAGPHVKWGGSTAPLQRSISSAAGSDPFAISAFNASYTDTGLFGFVLSAPANIAGTVSWLFIYNNNKNICIFIVVIMFFFR